MKKIFIFLNLNALFSFRIALASLRNVFSSCITPFVDTWFDIKSGDFLKITKNYIKLNLLLPHSTWKNIFGMLFLFLLSVLLLLVREFPCYSLKLFPKNYFFWPECYLTLILNSKLDLSSFFMKNLFIFRVLIKF